MLQRPSLQGSTDPKICWKLYEVCVLILHAAVFFCPALLHTFVCMYFKAHRGRLSVLLSLAMMGCFSPSSYTANFSYHQSPAGFPGLRKGIYFFVSLFDFTELNSPWLSAGLSTSGCCGAGALHWSLHWSTRRYDGSLNCLLCSWPKSKNEGCSPVMQRDFAGPLVGWRYVLMLCEDQSSTEVADEI